MTEFSKAETDAMIANIMEGFDFEQVHKHMKATNWKWVLPGMEMGVPNINQIKSCAKRLLHTLVSGEDSNVGTGGFVAYRFDWGIKLAFELESMGAGPR